MAIVDTLKRCELFKDLDEGQLNHLAELCRDESYRQGYTIFKEGTKAKEFYILTDGQLSLEIELRPVQDLPAIPTSMQVITESECFGWSAIIGVSYTQTARCMTPCKVLAIKGDIFLNAMANDLDMGYKVMRRLAQLIALRLSHMRLRITSGLGLTLLAKELEGRK
ncbi:cyclic nucleotide-binding domain-containing protein [Chloroflexota bacterium]